MARPGNIVTGYLERIQNGPERQARFELTGNRIHLGRGCRNNFILPHLTISRNHAEFQFNDNNWEIKDVSQNGISINYQRITSYIFVLLENNDIISFVPEGQLDYRFVRQGGTLQDDSNQLEFPSMSPSTIYLDDLLASPQPSTSAAAISAQSARNNKRPADHHQICAKGKKVRLEDDGGQSVRSEDTHVLSQGQPSPAYSCLQSPASSYGRCPSADPSSHRQNLPEVNLVLLNDDECLGDIIDCQLVREEAPRESQAERTDRTEEQFQGQLVQVLEDEFNCVICSDVLIEPSVVDCGHQFCSHCIQVWISERRQNGSIPNCPSCRVPIGTPRRLVSAFLDRIYSMLSPAARENRQQILQQRQVEHEDWEAQQAAREEAARRARQDQLLESRRRIQADIQARFHANRVSRYVYSNLVHRLMDDEEDGDEIAAVNRAPVIRNHLSANVNDALRRSHAALLNLAFHRQPSRDNVSGNLPNVQSSSGQPAGQSTSGLSSQSAPGTSSQSAPGTSSQSAPGTSSQSTPGTSSQSSPAISRHSAFAPISQSAPRTSSQSAAGISTQSATGTATQSTPGTSSQPAPRTSTQSTSGTSSQSTPGIIRQSDFGPLSHPRPNWPHRMPVFHTNPLSRCVLANYIRRRCTNIRVPGPASERQSGSENNTLTHVYIQNNNLSRSDPPAESNDGPRERLTNQTENSATIPSRSSNPMRSWIHLSMPPPTRISGQSPVISPGLARPPSVSPVIISGLARSPSVSPAINPRLVTLPSVSSVIIPGLARSPSVSPSIIPGLARLPSVSPVIIAGLSRPPSVSPVIVPGLGRPPSVSSIIDQRVPSPALSIASNSSALSDPFARAGGIPADPLLERRSPARLVVNPLIEIAANYGEPVDIRQDEVEQVLGEADYLQEVEAVILEDEGGVQEENSVALELPVAQEPEVALVRVRRLPRRRRPRSARPQANNADEVQLVDRVRRRSVDHRRRLRLGDRGQDQHLDPSEQRLLRQFMNYLLRPPSGSSGSGAGRGDGAIGDEGVDLRPESPDVEIIDEDEIQIIYEGN